MNSREDSPDDTVYETGTKAYLDNNTIFCKCRRVVMNYFYLLLESKEMELSERSGSHSSVGS